MKQQNIVLLSQQGWEEGSIDTNARNMSRELARHNRVLYVNMPLDMQTVLRHRHEPVVQAKLRQVATNAPPVSVAERLWVYTPTMVGISINWLKSKFLFKRLNRLNSIRLAKCIRQATEAVGFGDSFVLLLDGLHYTGLELRQLLQPSTFVYYVRDYVLAVPYFRRHGPWAEEAIIRRADVVVANSAYLRDYAAQFNPHSFDVGQGCVLTRFQPDVTMPVPTDLAAVPGPRIGYVGNLTSLRLDIDLLTYVARQCPDWHLVLVGPQDAQFAASELHQLPNVHFLGPKKPAELPAYMQHFDVCINPQVVNDITIGNYPLKIDEYLAMGKPVVATSTIGMQMFAPYTYLPSEAAEWPALLAQAMAEDSPERAAGRIAFAQSHTWEACASAIAGAIEAVAQ